MSSKLPQLKNIIVLRSFAIIAVVLYHCYSPWLYAWDWYSCPIRGIYSFIMETFLVGRMPLFVCVSGYLFSHLYIDRGKYHSFPAFLSNKIKRLLVPCLLFTALMCLCLQDNYIEAVVGYGYHLWFLKMLFLCFMTCWVCATYIQVLRYEIFLLIIAVIMMFISVPNYFGLGQYFKYYIFFYGGYLFYKYRERLQFLFSKTSFCIIFVSYLTLCVVCAKIYYLHPQEAIEDIIHTNKYIVIIRMVLRPLMILLAFVFVDLILHQGLMLEKIFVSLNKLSYGIYLFHMLFIQLIHKYFLSSTLGLAEEHYVITPLIYFIVITSISILLTSLLKRTKWGVYLIG